MTRTQTITSLCTLCVGALLVFQPGCSGNTGGAQDSSQLGVQVPAALSGDGPNSTLNVTLNFASKTDFNDTKYLAFFYVKSADPATTCQNVWAKTFGVSDPSRLNISAYPVPAQNVTIEPANGTQALFIYTFTNLPSAVCLKDSDCAGVPSAGDAAPACVPGGAGLGLCSPTAAQYPTSGGCSVVTITDGATTTAALTLTERP